MRTLDQFKTLFAKVADGIAGARPSSGCERAAHESNAKSDQPPNDQRAVRTPTARDGEKPARPSGSYPAVWPR